jgi:D-amino peptidase
VKLLISADMEGIAGVVVGDQTLSTHPEYARFRKLMTAEVNAAVQGALSAGAGPIVVADSHASMTNLLIEELDPAVELISGGGRPLGMMHGIEAGVDAVFLIGYHAASGTGAAVLEHTWSGRVMALRLNGQEVGETGFNAALAGAYGAPVVLVSGDRAVTEEARALLGPIETVAVKEGITRISARCLHPQVAQERIRQAAARALAGGIARPAPWVLATPVTVQIAFRRATEADYAALTPGSRRLDGRTVEWTGPDMPATYRTAQAMMLLASMG